MSEALFGHPVSITRLEKVFLKSITVSKMCSKDPGSLYHCCINLIWICTGPFISPLYLYLIRKHIDHSQDLCSDLSHRRDMHHISCIMRSLLLFFYAVHTADGCTRLWASLTIPSVSCPAYLHAGHTSRLNLPKHNWLILYLSQTFCSAYFLFLFNPSRGKGSRSAN